jgi:hypothetical protein
VITDLRDQIVLLQKNMGWNEATFLELLTHFCEQDQRRHERAVNFLAKVATEELNYTDEET